MYITALNSNLYNMNKFAVQQHKNSYSNNFKSNFNQKMCYNEINDVYFGKRNKNMKKQAQEQKINRMAELLSVYDYENMINKLDKNKCFLSGVHYIEIDKNNKNCVHLSILDPVTEEYICSDMSVDDFAGLLNKLNDLQCEEYPNEETNYTDLTKNYIGKLKEDK